MASKLLMEPAIIFLFGDLWVLYSYVKKKFKDERCGSNDVPRVGSDLLRPRESSIIAEKGCLNICCRYHCTVDNNIIDLDYSF